MWMTQSTILIGSPFMSRRPPNEKTDGQNPHGKPLSPVYWHPEPQPGPLQK